jgi:hypothetical protein
VRIWTSLFVLFTVACGSSGSGGSGQTSGGAAGSGTGGSGGIGSTGGSGAAAGSGSSAGSGGSGTGGTPTGGSGGNAGGPPCEPAPGTEAKSFSCDFVRVGIIEHPGQAPRLDLRARVSGGEGCVIIDEVILGSEANPLQTIPTGGIEAVEYAKRLLETEADPDIAALCNDEKKRIEPFGFVAKGRTDGGTFTAKCGAAGTGTSWPPGVAMTCHSGISEAPSAGNSIVDSYATLTNTTLYASFRHPTGSGKLTSVGPDVRIIPFPAPYSATPPLNPFDSSGWTGSASETIIDGQEYSQLHAFNPSDVLGTDICPVWDPNDLTPPAKPVYIARVGGQTTEGAFESEILVDICTRAPPAP